MLQMSPIAWRVPPRLRFGTLLWLSCTLLAGCGEDAPPRELAGVGGGGAANTAGSSSSAATAGAGAGRGGGGGGTASSGSGSVAGNGTFAGGGVGGGSAPNGGSAGQSDTGGGGLGGTNLGGAGGASIGGNAGAASGGVANQPTTIWIAGDSTVMTYEPGNTKGNNGTSLEGWGQELGSHFNDKVTINNQAIGGRSVAMFMWTVATDSAGAQQCSDNQGTPLFKLNNGSKIDTSQWTKIKAGIKAGDFLLIQFGHNDETHTCPRFVTTTDYATYLGFMADTVIAKGATPVFVTPMGHRSFNGTKFNNTLLPYAQSMKSEAQLKSLEVIDLNLRSGEYYEKVGNAFLAQSIFDGGTTHFIKPGAVQMASLIAIEIKKQGGRLASYLK